MLAFHKATNRRNILVDRGVISFRAYRNLFQRNLDETYDEDEACLSGNSLSVYLHAPADIIKKRFVEHNEPPLPFNTTVEEHLYEHWFAYLDYKNAKMELDTSALSVDECVQLIITKLKTLEGPKHEL